MNPNKHITIIPSPELARMRLTELAGHSGTIAEDLTDESRRNIGYMVLLDEPHRNEALWYIPDESVEYDE